MQTTSGAIQLKDLRQEFESLSLLAKEFPNKLEIQKQADALELKIAELESKWGM